MASGVKFPLTENPAGDEFAVFTSAAGEHGMSRNSKPDNHIKGSFWQSKKQKLLLNYLKRPIFKSGGAL
jgi:hypothetical protein